MHITSDRLLVSRPGFAADPAMPHAQKAFDSDWAYAGQLIDVGWSNDPAGPVSTTGLNATDATWDASPWVINFPPCSFIPAVVLLNYFSPTYILKVNEVRAPSGVTPIYWEMIQLGSQPPYNTQSFFGFEVTNQSIIITRRQTGQAWRRWRYALYWEVYGLAGP